MTIAPTTSRKMPEIIVLDDEGDDVVPKASMEALSSPPPVQLSDEQRQRMAQQKELAWARRQARENSLSSRSGGGQESALLSSQTQPYTRIFHSSEFPTAGEGQGNIAAGASGGFKRMHGNESEFIDLTTTDYSPDGWRSVRKRPMPGQSFGREITSEHFAPASVVVNGTTSSSTLHGSADMERTTAGGAAMSSLSPTPTEDPKLDGQNPPPQPKVAPRPSEQQMQVLNAIRHGKSVFVTGSAGTGKSFVIEYAVRLLKIIHGGDGVYVTASTGLAACALGGTTVHSFAGVGLGNGKKEVLVDKAKGRREVRNRWMYAKALIIDEISMIDGELFDKLDFVGRKLRNKSQPFGGIQLIVTGDFYQLPPVNPENPNKYFAFNADCWDRCFDLQIELKTVFRQSDHAFVDLLNEIRRGKCSPSVRQRLQNCHGPVGDNTGVIMTRLYPRKVDVGLENDQNLRALGQPTVLFKAIDSARSDFAKKQLDNMMVSSQISLSCGAQVMLAKNLETSAGLVNGARGVVVGFTRPQERRSLLVEASAKPVSPSGMWPVVKFASDNVERMIMPESWTIMEGDKEVAMRTQIPLLLAWALSVHKCQGMTLDRVETDLSKAFDYGMVYVALSRVKSLDGLRLIGFDPSKIKVHQKVALFYDKLKAANDINESTCTD